MKAIRLRLCGPVPVRQLLLDRRCANVIGQPIPLNGVRAFPIFPAPKKSFGPSVGFAYSPQWGGFLTGHGKTTFRGGYRMLYDPPFYNIYINMSSSSPAVFLQNLTRRRHTSPPGNMTALHVRASLLRLLQKGVFDPRQFNDTTMSPNFGPDKVHSWSFGLEREVTKKAAIEARYVGNRGQNLFQSINGNPDVSGLQAVLQLDPGWRYGVPSGECGCSPGCRQGKLQPGHYPHAHQWRKI